MVDRLTCCTAGLAAGWPAVGESGEAVAWWCKGCQAHGLAILLSFMHGMSMEGLCI